jgi:hypothetical protein
MTCCSYEEVKYHLEELSLDVSSLPNFLNEPTGKLTVNKEATYGFASIDEQQISRTCNGPR